MLITDERLEKALMKIAKTDELAAELHTKMERSEYRAKAIKDAVFLRIDGGSVAERQAKAGTSEDYANAMEEYFAALQAHDTLKNERAREFLICELWRSLSSARTKGLIQ